MLAGDTVPLSEFAFGQAVPESFVFSPDGRYLYGSSYYTGVSNIYRYEVATGKVEAVSNAETGFFRPLPLADGRLVALEYTGEGFVPVIINPKPIQDLSPITFLGAEVAEKYPEVKTWQVPGPGTVDDQALVTKKEPYVPWRSLELVNAYPVLQGYKNNVGVGYQFNFEDPLNFASLGITTAYTPSSSLPADERGHVELNGRYEFWRAALSWNRSDFYDLFGPVKRSRKGYAAKLGYDWLVIYDAPRRFDVTVDLAYYDQIDTLPTAQNISTPFTRLVTGEVAARYTDVKRSLGAVDDEKGYTWALVYTGNRVSGEITPQVRGELAYGFPLPLPHSSLWLRAAGGWANRRPQQHRREFLLRRVRQQLRRRQVDQALSQLRFAARLRHRRSERAEIRAWDGRMGFAGVRFRVGRHAGLSPPLAAAVAVRGRALGGSRQPVAAQAIREPGRSGRLVLQRAAPLRHDAVGRLRDRAPKFAAQGQRVYDLAQDHVAR